MWAFDHQCEAMSKPKQIRRESKWAWVRNLSKQAWAIIGAVGVALGAVLGIIQFVDWGRNISESPIRVDYGYHGAPAFGAIVGEFDPGRDPDYYLQERLVAYSHPFVFVDVTSQVEDETVTLSPYLVVEVTDVRPTPRPCAGIRSTPTGGSSWVRLGLGPKCWSDFQLFYGTFVALIPEVGRISVGKNGKGGFIEQVKESAGRGFDLGAPSRGGEFPGFRHQ